MDEDEGIETARQQRQSVGGEGEPVREEEDENGFPPPDDQDEFPRVEDEPMVWACTKCTFGNSIQYHRYAICRARRPTQEEEREYANAVAAPANEDLSKDDGTEENEEFVSSSPKDPEYTATDPTSRKRPRILRKSTNTPDPYRTPEPSARLESAPDRAKDPTCRKLFAVEDSTPPTTTPPIRQRVNNN
jgi:hypothetical protein